MNANVFALHKLGPSSINGTLHQFCVTKCLLGYLALLNEIV